ncbi:MAG TPA: hypothetical protein VNF46_00745, partial [Gammaproteobacteria bacterium]|nr:hypothetical protein [Gammaproteobacteria bacterium]
MSLLSKLTFGSDAGRDCQPAVKNLSTISGVVGPHHSYGVVVEVWIRGAARAALYAIRVAWH